MLTLLAAAGCQLSHRSDMEATTAVNGDPGAPMSSPPGEPVQAAPRPTVRLLDPARLEIAVATVDDCTAAPAVAVLHLNTQIVSVFGEQSVELSVRGDGPTESVQAEVEGYRSTFTAAATVKSALVKRICAKLAMGATAGGAGVGADGGGAADGAASAAGAAGGGVAGAAGGSAAGAAGAAGGAAGVGAAGAAGASAGDAVGGAMEIMATTPEVDAVREWMEVTAPDCQKQTLGAIGWQCRLPVVVAEAARQELTGSKRR